MIKNYTVKVYERKVFCDECGEELLPASTVLMTYPERFPYYCPKCSFTTTFTHSERPGIIYETGKEI